MKRDGPPETARKYQLIGATLGMDIHAVIALIVALCVGSASAAQNPAPGTSWAIVDATIIDGNGGPPIPQGTVIIEGGRIAAVGPAATIPLSAGTSVVRATGKYLVPGFVDANVHILVGSPEDVWVRHESRFDDIALEGAQRFLKFGVTTIRDTYGVLKPLLRVRDAIAAGKEVGPRMYVAGNIIGWGGPFSFTYLGFAATPPSKLTFFQRHIQDEMTAGVGEELIAMEPDSLRAAVARYIETGVNMIKYGGTTHLHNPSPILFSPRGQEIIVQEAHKHGLSVDTHATTPEAMRLAVLAGVDVIQHANVMDVPASDDLAHFLGDHSVTCVIFSYGKSTRELDEAKRRIGPPQKASGMATTPAAFLADALTDRDNAVKMIRAGCRVAVGTDAGLIGYPDLGRPLPPEYGAPTLGAIENLVDLGMTPLQAITAATKNGAIASRALNEYGTIEAGKSADLVLLDGDPLADIRNIRRQAIVVREGRIVDTSHLPSRPLYPSSAKAGSRTITRELRRSVY